MKARAVTRARAKALRAELTDAERILWSRLKGRQLRGWQFRVQHPVDPYILDFACVALKLAVEVDGATHGSVEERERDERRSAFLEGRGWSVVRVWNDDVYRNLNGVLETILMRLPPPPSR
jgi:very-short-patch-repair endonuclease